MLTDERRIIEAAATAPLLERIAELEAELATKASYITHLQSVMQGEMDKLGSVAAEMDALRVDAERYRWLRVEHERLDPICHLLWKRNGDRSSSGWVNTSILDVLIDQSIKDATK